MKFTFEDTQLIKDENGMPVLDENGTPKFTNKKYYFLRTLKTEEMFRDDLGAEMNAQLAEILQTIMDVESDDRDLEALSRMTSLENIDAIHQVLKYMYAEMNAQLAEILQTIMDVESDDRDLEALSRMTSLENIDAIHQVLKYMYAEKKGDSLVQNEDTRSAYEKLDLYEKGVIGQYFRRI